MERLQYTTHLLLQSKYAFIFKLIIIFTIYLAFNYDNISFCMMKSNTNPKSIFSGIRTGAGSCNISTIPNPVQETSIPHDMSVIAEAKEVHRPSQQMLAIKREIMTYASGQVHLLERVDEQARIIEEQKNTIAEMQETISDNYRKIIKLDESIEGFSVGKTHIEGYKEKITKLENKIAALRQDLLVSESLLAEAKADKNRLYSIIGDVLTKR